MPSSPPTHQLDPFDLLTNIPSESALPYRSSKVSQPRKRYGFPSHSYMTVTLSSISILTLFKLAMEHNC